MFCVIIYTEINLTNITMELSKKRKYGIYLNEYYFSYGFGYLVLRLFAGPAILILGLIYFLNSDQKGIIAYSGLMIGFGIYYIMKPFIHLIFNESWYHHFESEVEIFDDEIVLTNGEIRIEIPKEKILNLQKRKNYYVVDLDAKQKLYLPFEKLNGEEISKIKNMNT